MRREGDTMAVQRTPSDLNEAPLRPGQRLPALALPAVPDGRPVSLRDPARGAPVLVVLRYDDEEGAAELEWLARAAGRLEPWAGRPLAIVALSLEEATELVGRVGGVPFPVLADVDGSALRRLNVPADRSALVIADRWGLVYHSVAAEGVAQLPEEDELVEWVRYLATQCPECGVPDEPGHGEWEA